MEYKNLVQINDKKIDLNKLIHKSNHREINKLYVHASINFKSITGDFDETFKDFFPIKMDKLLHDKTSYTPDDIDFSKLFETDRYKKNLFKIKASPHSQYVITFQLKNWKSYMEVTKSGLRLSLNQKRTDGFIPTLNITNMFIEEELLNEIAPHLEHENDKNSCLITANKKINKLEVKNKDLMCLSAYLFDKLCQEDKDFDNKAEIDRNVKIIIHHLQYEKGERNSDYIRKLLESCINFANSKSIN